MEDSKFLQVAKEAAIEAGKIVKKYYRSELELHGKGHVANFATKADLESEAKVIEVIKKYFPEHNIIGEEGGEIDNGSEYCWIIDPIDGTIPFVDGISTFGVSVGLFKNKKPFVGVINMVAQDDLFWAEEGKGAFKNGNRIQIRQQSDLENCTLALEFGHTNRQTRIEKHFKPIVSKVRYAYVFGSAVKALTSVAEGVLDACLIRAHPWDFAAGVIMITEAGGRVSDPQGKEPDYLASTFELLCSNGLVHEELIKVFS